MRTVLAVILATFSTTLASHGSPGTLIDAQTTHAPSPLPSPSSTPSPAPTGTATRTAHRLVTRMTPAPSVAPTTLATLARSHKDKRDNTWVYSNGMYSFISEYDGRLVTVKPCRPATTLNYHGTHSLLRLDGNRCPGCNRVLDPNDDGAYNGRYRGGHNGWHSHDEDLNDPQIENQCP